MEEVVLEDGAWQEGLAIAGAVLKVKRGEVREEVRREFVREDGVLAAEAVGEGGAAETESGEQRSLGGGDSRGAGGGSGVREGGWGLWGRGCKEASRWEATRRRQSRC